MPTALGAMTTSTPLLQCPRCGYYTNAVTDLLAPDDQDPRPESGDWTVCISCVTPLRYVGPPLRLVLVTEMDRLLASPERLVQLEHLQALIREGHRRGLRPRGRHAS